MLGDNREELVAGLLGLHNLVTLEHYRKGDLIYQEAGLNTFTTEGIARLLNIFFGATGKAASPIVYCGLFKANVTPAIGDTAAVKLGAAGTYQECQDADYGTPATNKPSYVIASTATAGCTNDASKASFTMAAAINAYGTFLSLGQAKTDTTGPLICGKRFDAAPRATQIADVLAITYAITCTTS
jgi:hypothetical protein